MISSSYCVLSRVCYLFCFDSIKNVTKCNISRLVTWSKFKVSCQPRLWITKLYASFFLSRRNNFVAVKIKEKNSKCLKDEVWVAQRITSIRILSSETHKHWGVDTAQYGLDLFLIAELRWPEGPPRGAPNLYRKVKQNPWIDFLMVIMTSGIARGRVRTTATESRKMAAILQQIGWERHAPMAYTVLLWFWTSMLRWNDTCQRKASAD